MHHPYQCLAICAPAQDPRTKFLLAASGHKLFSVSLEDGSIVFSWPMEELKVNANSSNPSAFREKHGRIEEGIYSIFQLQKVLCNPGYMRA
jgi:hypothetical protein